MQDFVHQQYGLWEDPTQTAASIKPRQGLKLIPLLWCWETTSKQAEGLGFRALNPNPQAHLTSEAPAEKKGSLFDTFLAFGGRKNFREALQACLTRGYRRQDLRGYSKKGTVLGGLWAML